MSLPAETGARAANTSKPNPWRFCVAPMMDWTDRHCRYFHRQMSRHARLYTEMVTTGALRHGDIPRHLGYDRAEHPVALQIGGSDVPLLANAAELGAQYGYDELNLNCGCPSDRVQDGGFGACLMMGPKQVAAGVRAMQKASGLPVTVKCRIGVDYSEDYVFLRDFVEPIAETGCTTFIVHARKAWLSGLSPKENREIPPLRYDTVYKLKQDFPQLTIVINGGIHTIEESLVHLKQVDGVMLGREVYENPYRLAEVDARLFGETAAAPTRAEVVERMRDYIEDELDAGNSLAHISRHMLGLYRNQPGGRMFRRVLSEREPGRESDWETVELALAEVERATAAMQAKVAA
ncbi:MAG: tRNA dihydrouridine(20/20a) synthase DusA [Nevskia sp.]